MEIPKKVLVIIPAYNEEQNIQRVVENLLQNDPSCDYIIVNDGSTDHTADICRANHYPLIDQPVNLGLAGAFQTGMKYAYQQGYDAALQFDADGQHLPQYIRPMADKLEAGSDVVIGSRFLEKKKPFSARMAGSFLISAAIRLTTGQKLTDPTSGMRMYNKQMIAKFAQRINYGPEPDTISYLMKSGANVKEVQVEMADRIAGESYLNIANSIRYMLRMGISILLVQAFRGSDKLCKEGEEIDI